MLFLENIPFFKSLFLFMIGLLAGVINTFAGNGSVFTLGTFLFLGLPPNLANGTNRLGILMQNLVAVFVFLRNKKIPSLKENLVYVLPVLISGVLGGFWVIYLDEKTLNTIIVFAMLLALTIILFNPVSHSKKVQWNWGFKKYLAFIVFAFIGLYGGIIQIGMGVVFLSCFFLFSDKSLVEANGLKILLILLYTIPVFFIFLSKDLIDWKIAIPVAIGQMSGGYFASKWAVKSSKANIWIRRVLIVMILIYLLRFFYISSI